MNEIVTIRLGGAEIGLDVVGVLVILVVLVGVPLLLIYLAYRRGRAHAPQMWQAALGTLPLGVVLFDRAGRRSFSNAPANELLSKLPPGPIDQARVAAAQGLTQSMNIRGGNGVVVKAQSMPLGHDAGVVLALTDIAPQQQAEANYQKLIHTLSHELLTPMTAMKGHLSHIALAEGRAEGWERSLHAVRDDLERLIRLTYNLLYLSRMEAGQPLMPRPTNLAAVVEEAILQLLEKADTRQITLNVNAEQQLPRPSVDRDAWKEVFVNLIDNGIKYGCDGGNVWVTLRHAPGGVAIDVADNGPGIPPDDLPHLFTELFRSDAQRHVSGSGLGLALVRRIVERHGGTITCSSELGRGTTFHINLPVTNQGS